MELDRGGFTLLELLIVIAVLAIASTLGAAVLPDWGDRNGLRTAAAMVDRTLAKARSKALASQAPVEIAIDGAGRRLEVEALGLRQQLPPGVALAIDTAPGLWSGDGPARLVVFPDGSSTLGRLTLGINARRMWKADGDWSEGRGSEAALARR